MNMILAVDKNWAIGCDGGLLVHLPGDLKFFKEQTSGKTVIMGRTTMESLPGKKPLPNRENIVMTRQEDFEKDGFKVLKSKEAVLDYVKDMAEDQVFIIGGEQIYKSFLSDADTIYLTKIDAEFKADRYFVNLDEMPEFKVTWESRSQDENGIVYKFYKYERVK